MDDLRTKETLDALADLFLTGTTPAKPTPPVRVPPRKPSEQGFAPPADLTPKVVVTQDALDSMSPKPAPPGAADAAAPAPHSVLNELDGPGSYTLGKPNTSAAHYSDEHDHAAPSPLRLRDTDDAADEASASVQPTHVEAVFLGNLPGFGGPWLTQYASHLAQQRGPVAVLHVIGDRVDLELVTAQRQAVRPGIDDPISPGSQANGETLMDRLDRLASDAAHPVTTWLIHLPSPTDPTQLPRAAAIDRWTLLCGGDDMAVAAATRMLQAMREHGAAADRPAPVTGVMVMGSDEVKAREAIDKFNAAAVGFLPQPVELIGSRKQMTPVHTRALGGCAGPGIWDDVNAFLHSLPGDDDRPMTAMTAHPAMPAPAAPAEQASTASTFPAAAPSAPPSETPVHDNATAAVIEPPSEVEHLTRFDAFSGTSTPRFAPAATAPTPSSPSSPSTSPRSPRQAAIGQAPTHRGDAHAAPAPSSINEPDLASLLTAAGAALAGGVALDARYPRQSDTQLLLDQQGRLHLLRRQVASDLRAALVDLMEARDWLREHIDLVILTQRQCRFDTAAEPVLHLFTADAKNAVAMVTKLGPSVKLHLLQEVRIGAARTWVCTELN